MPSPICFQLRQICSWLLALQGCQGARMIPAGKTFPSRHKLGCPKQPQAAQLYNWSGSIPAGQSLHTPSLHHPAPTEMACLIQRCQPPQQWRLQGLAAPRPMLGDCCPSPLAWDSLMYPLHTHSSAGTLLLAPSLSSFWYMTFLRVVILEKGILWK